MPGWVATSPDLDPIIDGRSSPKLKAQVKAASKAAELLAKAIDEECNVAISGYAGTKDDTEPDQIQVVVARASE